MSGWPGAAQWAFSMHAHTTAIGVRDSSIGKLCIFIAFSFTYHILYANDQPSKKLPFLIWLAYQLVPNTLARVVIQKSRFCHITPVLTDLPWLPIRHRINFKIATVAFKLLHFHQPSYLAALVWRYVPTRSLRSSSLSICIPTRKTAMARSKSFSSVASKIWNGYHVIFHPFPLFLLSGKRLKHHLFLSTFPSISSPSTDITLCDVTTSTNVNHIRWTLPVATQQTCSSWAPTICLDFHQNTRRHTGACVNVVLLTYSHAYNQHAYKKRNKKE